MVLIGLRNGSPSGFWTKQTTPFSVSLYLTYKKEAVPTVSRWLLVGVKVTTEGCLTEPVRTSPLLPTHKIPQDL